MHGGEDRADARGDAPGAAGPPAAGSGGAGAEGPPATSGPAAVHPPGEDWIVWIPPGPPPAAGPPSTEDWAAWMPPGSQPLGGASFPATPPSPLGRRRGRFGRVLTVLAVSVVVVAVAAVVIVDALGSSSDESAASWRAGADPEDLEPWDDVPSRGPRERPDETTTSVPPQTTTPPTRLAPPPTAPPEPGPHAFIDREADGDPITWDPCETIQYVVNARTAPPGGPELLAEAIAETSAATGLVFEDRGATDEAPSSKVRPLADPDRYGEGWSPVLIAWTDATEVSDLDDTVAGAAAPYSVHAGGGRYENVSGVVHLDGPDLAELLDHGLRADVVALLLHELGHLIGLHHVDDTSQVMYHNRDGRAEVTDGWSPGDLTGLAALGNGPCNPDT